MTGLEAAARLAVVAIGSALGASALVQASWPRRSPAAAILLWQALGLDRGLAAVGTLVRPRLPGAHPGGAACLAAVGTLASIALRGAHLGVAGSLLLRRTVFPAAAFRFPSAFGTVSA